MFRTYRHAEIPITTRLEPGLQLWRSVEQILQLPWVYVTLARRQGDVTVRDMLMIADVNTLESLREALYLSPTNGLIMAKLARQMLAQAPDPNSSQIAEAEFLTRRALILTPLTKTLPKHEQ